MTLRELIDRRNIAFFSESSKDSLGLLSGVTNLPVIKIMRDILIGLGFLHAREISHCDLKPSNIFFVGGMDAKIGDFGMMNERDYSVDLASAGLIFFELLYPMNTYMERVTTLSKIKHGEFPIDFVDTFPRETELIRLCMDGKIGTRNFIKQLKVSAMR